MNRQRKACRRDERETQTKRLADRQRMEAGIQI